MESLCKLPTSEKKLNKFLSQSTTNQLKEIQFSTLELEIKKLMENKLSADKSLLMLTPEVKTLTLEKEKLMITNPNTSTLMLNGNTFT